MKPEEFEVYVIPPNFMEGGTLFGGLLKTRNTIEAVILGLAVGVPVLHLPFSLTVRVVILCLTALPLVLLALIGVKRQIPNKGTVVLLTLAYKPDSVRRWIAPHTDLSPCPDKGNCAKLIYRGIVPQDMARVKQETQYIVFNRGVFYRYCVSAYSFTNRPMGQMWVKPGVEMYQQPGPSGSQLISMVISRHPSGKSAWKVSPA